MVKNIKKGKLDKRIKRCKCGHGLPCFTTFCECKFKACNPKKSDKTKEGKWEYKDLACYWITVGSEGLHFLGGLGTQIEVDLLNKYNKKLLASHTRQVVDKIETFMDFYNSDAQDIIDSKEWIKLKKRLLVDY